MERDERKAAGSRSRYRRTTLCVDQELYRRFKAHAARRGVSVTSLFTRLMEETLGKDGEMDNEYGRQ